MSRVYLAEDTRLELQVAVKENLQTSRQAQHQFEREAKILARLDHPNLPGVSDHFIDPRSGRQYLVMDYVQGDDLETIIQRSGPLPEATALNWVRQVMDALEYLHRQQPPVIHRDVKPGNIKITPHGKAMLVDFGISKVYDPGSPTPDRRPGHHARLRPAGAVRCPHQRALRHLRPGSHALHHADWPETAGSSPAHF